MSRVDNRFMCRIGVPAHLRAAVGKSELTRSLGDDRVAAERLLPAVVAEFYGILDKARAAVGGDPGEAPSAPPRRLSPPEMARLLYAEQIEKDDKARLVGPVVTFDAFAKGYADWLRKTISGEATDEQIDAAIGWAIDDFRSRGFHSAARGTPEWRLVARALASAELEHVNRTLERDRGDFAGETKHPLLKPATEPIPDPVPASAPHIKVPTVAVSIQALFRDYVRELKAAGRGETIESRWGTTINRLIDFVGHDDVTRMTKGDFVRWKDDMVAKGSALKTVRDVHLAAVKAVLRWACENDRIAVNPAEVVRVKVITPRRTREKGFTDDEAVAILKAARDYRPTEYAYENLMERPWTTAAKRWVPWVCALTGARAGEIVQLRKEDVREKDGVRFFRITPEAGTVKTKNFRDVPIHPQLVEIGFLDYVNSLGDGPIFQDTKSTRPTRKVVAQIVSVLGRWVRGQKLIGEEVDPNHGWRHRFKTVGREKEIDPRVIDAIQGHSARTAGEDYGDVTLITRKNAIEKFPHYDVK